MSWLATFITIVLELVLTFTLFMPFVDWPQIVKRVRLIHVVIGVVYSYIVYQLIDISIEESIVFGLLWLTMSLTVVFL